MMEPADTAAPAPSGWRLRLGIFFFALGLLSPGFVPVVALAGLPLEWKATISGLLLVGIPEVLWLAAVVVMGEPGFNFLKAKALGLFRRYALPRKVSRARYRLGLVMFVVPVLFGWLVSYLPRLVPGYEEHRLAVNLGCDGLLLASLFVLGGDFWDKLRALFIYEAKVRKLSV